MSGVFNLFLYLTFYVVYIAYRQLCLNHQQLPVFQTDDKVDSLTSASVLSLFQFDFKLVCIPCESFIEARAFQLLVIIMQDI